jgi:hypothetical protein
MSAEKAPLFRFATITRAVLIAVAAAAAFMVLLVFAPDLRDTQNGQAHALSRSAVGYAGVLRLIQSTGVKAEVNRKANISSGQSDGLLILTPRLPLTEEMLKPYMAKGYRVLVIQPKWNAQSDPDHQGWVVVPSTAPAPDKVAPKSASPVNIKVDLPPADKPKPSEEEAAAPATDDNAQPAEDAEQAKADAAPLKLPVLESLTGVSHPDLWPNANDSRYREDARFRFGPVKTLRYAKADRQDVELWDHEGHAIVVGDRNKGVYFLTDPDLVNNQGLKDEASAQAAVDLILQLRDGNGPVIFDVTLNGLTVERSVFKTALQPPFLSATLCILSAALLLGWRNMTRFGAPLRPERAVQMGKRMLVENASGLIRLAGRTPKMAPRYAALMRQSIAHSVGAPRQLSPEALDAYLDRLADPTLQTRRFSGLMQRAPLIHDEAALVRYAHELFTFRTEVMRERR